MNTVTETTTNTMSNNKCKNISFSVLEEEFMRHNWLMQINEVNHILFKSPTSDYDYFEIKVDKEKINVTIPLKNSRYKYYTSFNSYFQACEYVEMHLRELTSDK